MGPLPTFPDARVRAQHLALCGDIGNLSMEVMIKQFYEFLRRCCEAYVEGYVFQVLGNHESYGLRVNEAIEKLRSLKEQYPAELSNLVILECDSFDIPGTDTRVLGCCLWSEPRPEAGDMLNDFRLIDGMDVETYRSLHRRHVEWLEEELTRVVRDEKQAVVLTHHAPFTSGLVPQVSFGKTLTDAGCLGTDLVGAGLRFNNHKYKDTIRFWAFGHTHLSYKRQTDCGITIVSNQYGYPQDFSKQHWFATVASYLPGCSWLPYDPNLVLAV